MNLRRLLQAGKDLVLAMSARGALADLRWTLLGLVVFMVAYVAAYAGQAMLPGPHPVPAWQSWYDQSEFLRSARAFAAGNFAPSQHWYPPGYALLAAPFVGLTPSDPFVIPNCVCFVLYFLGFMRLTRAWLPPLAALFCFALGTLSPPFLLAQYIYPWNTIPIAAAMVWLLVLVRAALDDARGWVDIGIGVLAGTAIAIRQIEVATLIPVGIMYLSCRLATRRFANIALAAFAFAIPIGLVAFVIYRVNGTLATPYVNASANIGFSLSSVFHRAIPLLLDASVYAEPAAAVRSFQPLVIAMLPACILGALLAWREFAAPVATCIAALILYISYNDFGPTNIVRYYLVHYVEWTFPVLIACGASVWASWLRQRRYVYIGFAATATIALTFFNTRLVPDEAYRPQLLKAAECSFEFAATEPARIDALDFLGVPMTAAGSVAVAADGVKLTNGLDYEAAHALPGLRLVFKRNIDPRSMLISLPLAQNPKCSAELIKPQRVSYRIGLPDAQKNQFADDDSTEHVLPVEEMMRQIGYIQARPDGGYSVVADTNEEGYVAYGPSPYENLREGGYAVTFALSGSGISDHGASVVFDVAGDINGKVGVVLATDARQPTDGGRTFVSLHILVPPGTGHLQYRVHKPLGYAVRFDGVRIRRLDDKQTKALVYELAHEQHQLTIAAMSRGIGHAESAGTNGGAAVVAGAEEEGYLAFGPNETLRPGRYTATFKVTVTDSPADGKGVLLDVIALRDDGVTLTTLANATPQSSSASISVPFQVTSDTGKLQYRVFKPHGYVARFAGVDIERLGD